MRNLIRARGVYKPTKEERMRKLSALVVLAALLAVPTALAKERNMTMTAADVAPKAGQPWFATIRVVMDGHPAPGLGPMVRVVNRTGKTVYIASKRTAKAGIYLARIVFPTAGTWRVIAVDRYSGRSYEFNRVTVR
jgi:hypothetical protein